jgi:tetratricopeptide (TPR) repeat protein
MILKYSLLSLTVILILSRFLFADEDWIKETIDESINTKFAKAEEVIHEQFALGDSGAAVYFYYASILNSKMTHFENDDDVQEFTEAIDKVNTICTETLTGSNTLTAQKKARLYFYRGSALGYLAYYQGTHSEWFKALDNGLASINDLEEAIALDSTLYDAYLGIGVYKYWRSTKFKYVLWLPFVPDMREEGIAYIKKAAEKGKYSSSMAMHQLIYILLDYGKYDEAIPYAEEIVQRYPDSQFMWWAYAHVYFKRHEYKEAVDAYKRLLILIENDPNSNPNHWIFCNVRLAEILYRMGEYKSSISFADKVLKKKFATELSDKSREKIKQAKELIDESQKILANKSR